MNTITIQEKHRYVFGMYLLSTAGVETLTVLFLYRFMNGVFVVPIPTDSISIVPFLLFIPKTFLFELIYDFFHYWAHRISHEQPFLYQTFHKIHHTFPTISYAITFYQHPVDLFLSHSLPHVFTLTLMPCFSRFEYTLLKVYLTYIEISGHCGKHTYPNSSFSQFIWLPRLFRIELYSEDHYLHHTLVNCNYAKRFSFWDQVFGSYVPYN